MALAASGLRARGRDISLAALQRHDPYISRIVDVASQVALYTFGHRANEWEKTDVEGTLFVYTRSASPTYGFTIMNRLSMENRTEPITKDLDLQLQDPFLLYRNARLSIYGIWFYDKEECQRIAELMKNLTQSEQLRAGTGVPTMILSAGDGQEADILRMLTKARDEYAKCKTCSEPKPIASASAIHDNPNLIKPIPVKPGDSRPQNGPPASQASDPEPQHLSLTALFGKRGGAPGLRAMEPSQPQAPPVERLCPAIQKLMLQPLAGLREAQPARPTSPHHSHRIARPPSLLETLQGTPGTASKRGPSPPALASPTALSTAPPAAPAQPHPSCLTSPLPREEKEHPTPGSPAPPGSPGVLPPRELLRKLQAVQQQELQAAPRPALAARLPVLAQSSRAGANLVPAPSMEKPASFLQASSAQGISAAEPSLLMSPTAFIQAPTGDRDRSQEPPSLLLPLQSPEPPAMGMATSPLSRWQLQEALLYLIQNDDSFLNMIYEAYLFSMAQAALRRAT